MKVEDPQLEKSNRKLRNLVVYAFYEVPLQSNFLEASVRNVTPL